MSQIIRERHEGDLRQERLEVCQQCNCPRISGGDCTRALGKVGSYLKRQQSSHMILRRDNPFAQVVVPDHKDLDRGTLRAIIRLADLGVAEFVKLL